MNNIETRVFLETKLRNLKRKEAKLAQHADLLEETEEISKEIKEIEAQITQLQ